MVFQNRMSINILKLFSLQLVLCESASDIRVINDLRCEYLRNPLAVDTPRPRLNWFLEATDPKKQNLSQTGYQILVATDEQTLQQNVADLWDSKKVRSDRTTHIRYEGLALTSRQRAYWKVRVWDQSDGQSEWSSVAFWDKGMDGKDWSAEWIGAPEGLQRKALQNLEDIDKNLTDSKPGLVPVLYMRKTFRIGHAAQVVSARLYSTAHGVYRALINGQYVSDDQLSPGWTDYNRTVQYQSYDVSELMSDRNTIGVLLGTGWHAGYIGMPPSNYWRYGWTGQSLLLELHIKYANNSSEVIRSDSTWRVTTGPLIYSDLELGELYYQSRELTSWQSYDYPALDWSPAIVTKPHNKSLSLVADRAEPVRVTQELTPKWKYESSPGVWVVDFEQNMVGWVRIRIPGNRGSVRVQLRHAEVLNPNGTIYTLNLRSALATDTYVIEGNSNGTDYYTVEPHFTVHGFRYVEITGYPGGGPSLSDITGRVIHTNFQLTGRIQTSSKMVNQLFQNILWSQRANMISVPTDCPQRDERQGWTGDAEIVSWMASYNARVGPFYTKWLRDMRDGQNAEGSYSNVSPRMKNLNPKGSAGWSDAGIIVPYTVYRMYGDLGLVEESWPSMERWFGYILKYNPNYLWLNRTSRAYGDWLEIYPNGSSAQNNKILLYLTPKEVMATAYFGYDALLMARMAGALNRTEDQQKYLEYHSRIASAFVEAFVNQTDGRIKGDTQTDYALALAFELLPSERLIGLAVQHLADNIKAHDWHLTTGFSGTGYLCPMLTKYGHNAVAYRLLLQESYPSWGYQIRHNATTMWERWDNWRDDMGFQTPRMNSFNQYSLGSVGRWLYQSVAGIDTDELEVGFKRIIIRPNPGPGLSYVTSEFQSINGRISSSWTIDDRNNVFRLNTTIPVNTRAIIDLRAVRLNGTCQQVGSGQYSFEIQLD